MPSSRSVFKMFEYDDDDVDDSVFWAHIYIFGA